MMPDWLDRSLSRLEAVATHRSEAPMWRNVLAVVAHLVVFITIVVVVVMVISLAADAHTPAERADWYAAWGERAATGITPELLAELADFQRRHEVSPEPSSPRAVPTPGVYRGMGAGVERWFPLVTAHFPPEAVDTMMCLMSHESGGNPNAVNPTSGAAGLFQVMPFWWDHYGGDRFDPETNVRVARLIWDQQGYEAWAPWNRGLCRGGDDE